MYKKIPLLLLLLSISQTLSANDCYRAFEYNDRYKIKTTVDKNRSIEKLDYSGILHYRRVTKDNKKISFFWLENKNIKQQDIQWESINAPFLVKEAGKGFVISSIASFSRDKFLYDQLIGLVELMQFEIKPGEFSWKSTMGHAYVKQQFDKKEILISRTGQSDSKGPIEGIRYLNSKISIRPERECNWTEISASETTRAELDVFKISTDTERTFHVHENKEKRLNHSHWFMSLNTNPSSWGLKEDSEPKQSLAELLKKFDAYHLVMMTVMKDSKKFQKWIRENMDFLLNLPEILTLKTLDDELSQNLFAELGYIDTVESVEILSQVALHNGIIEKERFRALMGVKNTSAPMNQGTLSQLLNTGLQAEDEHFINNAMGMLSGALAKQRMRRDPEQANYIGAQIAQAIHSGIGITEVVLQAAGNMEASATEDVVTAIETVLSSGQNDKAIATSAKVLKKIGRSSLSYSEFEQVWSNTDSDIAKSSLIKHSSVAKDVVGNGNYYATLVDIVRDSDTNSDEIRISALTAMSETGYGVSSTQKKQIRQLMLGEYNKDISSLLREMYRKK